MADTVNSQPGSSDQAAVQRGRMEGVATAALALSLVSFINLLGAEKALLSLVLATLAFRGARSADARRRSLIAMGFSVLYVCTIIVVLVVSRDKLGRLIQLFHQLS